ncbi:hypothetical protein MU582_09610 [Nocardioidaceae bacterium SCSIO 66511]|nr:hypothetical protein MU582_09610 [Nocardioidaceae bacterium SCSIO 66511]
MGAPTSGVRTAAALLLAVAALAGCSNDSDAEEPTNDEASDSATHAGAENECTGDGKGAIAVGTKATKLPGGSTVAFDSADFDAKKPTVTFDLGKSSSVERKHATDLRVGDRFGLQRGFYVVVSICGDKATIDEF